MKCEICHKQLKPQKKAHNVKYCVECRKLKKAEYIKKWMSEKRGVYSPGKVKCEICGKYYDQVGTHIYQTHKMTARQYREEYGFDVKRGQLSENLRKIKAEHVFKNGTVKNLKKGKRFWFNKNSKIAGRYKRSEQTLERLKNNFNKKIC